MIRGGNHNKREIIVCNGERSCKELEINGRDRIKGIIMRTEK